MFQFLTYLQLPRDILFTCIGSNYFLFWYDSLLQLSYYSGIKSYPCRADELGVWEYLQVCCRWFLSLYAYSFERRCDAGG